jgi:hypothetical protein
MHLFPRRGIELEGIIRKLGLGSVNGPREVGKIFDLLDN